VYRAIANMGPYEVVACRPNKVVPFGPVRGGSALSTPNGREDRKRKAYSRRRGAMASVASCSCSTLFTFSSTPFRPSTFRPSPRTSPRHRRLPLPGLSVQRAPPSRFCGQRFLLQRGQLPTTWCDLLLQALRCLRSGEQPPPVGGGTGLSVPKAAEPVHGRGGFRAAPLRLAFATVAGMLMLQGSQQALAATEFAGLLPPDVLGELGDISTGFASVRTTAFASLFFPSSISFSLFFNATTYFFVLFTIA
jgi:hypothetical protein